MTQAHPHTKATWVARRVEEHGERMGEAGQGNVAGCDIFFHPPEAATNTVFEAGRQAGQARAGPQ